MRAAEAVEEAVEALCKVSHEQLVMRFRLATEAGDDQIILATSEWHGAAVDFKLELIILAVGRRKGEADDHLTTLVLRIFEDVAAREVKAISRIPEQPLLSLIEFEALPQPPLWLENETWLA